VEHVVELPEPAHDGATPRKETLQEKSCSGAVELLRMSRLAGTFVLPTATVPATVGMAETLALAEAGNAGIRSVAATADVAARVTVRRR